MFCCDLPDQGQNTMSAPHGFRGRLSSLAVALLLTTTAAHADYQHRFFVGGSLLLADSDRSQEQQNFGWQVGLGKELAPHWSVEGQLFGATIESGSKVVSDFYQYGLGVDLHYAFGDRNEMTPYVLAGLGIVRNDVVPDRLDDTTPFANIGAGLVGRIKGIDMLRYRVEARLVYDDFLNGVVDTRLSAGLEIPLGLAAPQVITREVPVEVERVVTREVPVERIVTKEVPVEVEKVVYRTPEPLDNDSDKDGVVNDKDKCPGTLPGAKVDGDGCVVKQTLTLNNISFATNSAKLTLDSKALLKDVVQFLQADRSVRMQISGHTDNVGKDAYNQKLSKARAASVRSLLVANGIDAKRLTSTGYGESRPISSNATEEGRETNRRVEFAITTKN